MAGNLLTNEDAAGFANQERLTLFVLMTCLNGYYQDPVLDSLAESLLKSEGGAVAAWASSGMTLPTGQAAMNREIIKQLFSGGGVTLGEATRRAKAAVSDADVRRTWTLFGDPVMRLK